MLAHASASDNIRQAMIEDGTIFGEIRYRYESVEQDNALEDADAHTMRGNFGYKTGVYKNFAGLVEAQIVGHIGDEDFNSLENNRTAYSIVADPDVAQINRVWLEFTGIPETSAKLGRQFINLNNQRFVGTVGWRQNDQTFDALTITNKSVDNLNLQYSYVDNVNRIFGDSTPADDLESQVHLANASYQLADWAKASVYGYWMEFKDAAALSNRTYGARIEGKKPLDDNWTVSYEAEIATQDDHQNNTTDYSENYYHISPKLSAYGFTLGAGYEVLQGNGTKAFQTPLATLHKFNGWADIFLNTPANGLKDAYIMGAYKVAGTDSVFDGTKLMAVYHDYEGDKSGDYGSELNVSLGQSFNLPNSKAQPFKKLSVLVIPPIFSVVL